MAIERAASPNHVWSYDIVADQTADGKTLRFLTVIDEFTREAIWFECARHLTSVDVVRVFEQLVELRGKPVAIKSDNGGVFRDGCLNRRLFESLREAREASEAWLRASVIRSRRVLSNSGTPGCLSSAASPC